MVFVFGYFLHEALNTADSLAYRIELPNAELEGFDWGIPRELAGGRRR